MTAKLVATAPDGVEFVRRSDRLYTAAVLGFLDYDLEARALKDRLARERQRVRTPLTAEQQVFLPQEQADRNWADYLAKLERDVAAAEQLALQTPGRWVVISWHQGEANAANGLHRAIVSARTTTRHQLAAVTRIEPKARRAPAAAQDGAR